MRTYDVRKFDEVRFIDEALRASDFEILTRPSPTQAPFIWEVRTPMVRENLRLVVYAFFANEYQQGNRPDDEHRFQIKYGSDLSGYHEIHLPESSHEVTLMFGIHFDAGILVAVDPAMHNPTRFSKTVEFKTRHIEATKRGGWFGWERERSMTRRDQPMPLDSYTTEALLGFTPEYLATYIQFERQATGAPSGERLLMIDKIGEALVQGRMQNAPESALATRPPQLPLFELSPPIVFAPSAPGYLPGFGPAAPSGLLTPPGAAYSPFPQPAYLPIQTPSAHIPQAAPHPLEIEFELRASQILDLIQGAFRLKVAVRGSVAEHHLFTQLSTLEGIDRVERIDADGKPDVLVRYQGKGPYFIECKNVLRRTPPGGYLAKVDFQRTRASKGDPCSRYYTRDDFHIVAACLHPLSERWEFRFTPTANVKEHASCSGHLTHKLFVTEQWADDVRTILSSLKM